MACFIFFILTTTKKEKKKKYKNKNGEPILHSPVYQTAHTMLKLFSCYQCVCYRMKIVSFENSLPFS